MSAVPSPLAVASARGGHHYGAAGGRFDAVDLFEEIAEFLGLLKGQADDLIAQLFG